MAYGGRGGHNSRGRGRGRGGRGRGRGGSNQPPHDRVTGQAHTLVCKQFMAGNCTHNPCNFDHVIQLHKDIQNSDIDPSQNNNSNRGYSNNSGYNNYNHQTQEKHYFPTTDIALWNDPSGLLKVFTSSHDGHWKLYNATSGFSKEVQHNMGGKVNKIMVESNFLFCAFEGTSIKIPNVKAGMIHAWNLVTPGDPPIELHIHETSPFAHGGSVSCFITKGDMCVSGGTDYAIRIWKYDATMNNGKGGFKLMKECFGHAGSITGLLMVGTMLWSCSTDMTIRLWDSNSNYECKYLITQNTQGSATAPVTPTGQQNGQGVGHKDAVSDLLAFESQAGKFVLSCSLDGHVKVWNSTNGECLSSTDHGVGLVSMALSADAKGNAILILGSTDGRIFFRCILQSPKTPQPMAFLAVVDGCFAECGHTSRKAIKSIKTGPSGTFYTVSDDGKLCVWQISDFNLN